jgi:hypothetical protein
MLFLVCKHTDKSLLHNTALAGNHLKTGKTKNTSLCAVKPLNENYFLRLYVYTSYADSKRSVSDRWLINDKAVNSSCSFSFYVLPYDKSTGVSVPRERGK